MLKFAFFVRPFWLRTRVSLKDTPLYVCQLCGTCCLLKWKKLISYLPSARTLDFPSCLANIHGVNKYHRLEIITNPTSNFYVIAELSPFWVHVVSIVFFGVYVGKRKISKGRTKTVHYFNEHRSSLGLQLSNRHMSRGVFFFFFREVVKKPACHRQLTCDRIGTP